MSKKLRSPRKPAETAPKYVIVVLSVFAALVLVVSAFALKSTQNKAGEGFPTTPQASGDASPSAPVVSPTPAETTEPDSEPSESESSPEPTESDEPQSVDVTVPDRILAAVNSNLLVRSTVASCDSQPVLEVSRNGGEDWSLSDSLADTSSTQALRIIPTRVGLIQLVALNEDCEPQLVRSEDQGESWLSPIGAVGAWYFDPQDANNAGGPEGSVELPCEAVSIAATDARAAVLCADGSLASTEDGGANWGDLVNTDNVVAVGVSDDSFIVALANAEDCTGISTASFNGERVGSEGGCFELEVTSGDTAVVRSGNSVFLWSGSDFATSNDGGRSWS